MTEQTEQTDPATARAAWIAAQRHAWDVSARRAELSEQEDKGRPPRASEWHDSDDATIDAAQAVSLRAHDYLTALGYQPMITVKVENDYECGRHSEAEEVVPMPLSPEIDDDWWQDNVPNGDGHPCGERENAIYEFTVIACPDRPELVGLSRECG